MFLRREKPEKDDFVILKISGCKGKILGRKDLSTYSQLVSISKPNTLTCRTFAMNGDIPPCALFNNIIYLLIRAQEGMQLVVAMILHVRFFGVSGLIYSPIANIYTGPFSISRKKENKISRHPYKNF